jgi:putative membrane protein
MHWLFRVALIIAGNALALWLANQYVPGFVLSANWLQLATIALILTLLNFIVKPILTLVLGPVIVLTLGLAIIVVNAIIIYLLPIAADHIDFLKGSISIQSILALLLATLIVSAVNFVIHLAT